MQDKNIDAADFENSISGMDFRLKSSSANHALFLLEHLVEKFSLGNALPEEKQFTVGIKELGEKRKSLKRAGRSGSTGEEPASILREEENRQLETIPKGELV